MPDKSSTDIVMRFTYGEKGPPSGGPSVGDPVLAECALSVDPDDDFMNGFKAADYDNYSNFFEVTKFSFNFGAKEGSDEKEDENFQRTSSVQQRGLGGGASGNAPANGKKKGSGVSGLTGEFAKWRSVNDPVWQDQQFGVDLESFSFSRLIDRASPTFFVWCANSYTFKRASLVKRSSVGLGANGNGIPQGYVRFDFENIMLKSVKWQDGECVVEDCEMVFEKYKVQYKRQKASGVLQGNYAADWDREYHTDPNRKKSGKSPRYIDWKESGRG